MLHTQVKIGFEEVGGFRILATLDNTEETMPAKNFNNMISLVSAALTKETGKRIEIMEITERNVSNGS